MVVSAVKITSWGCRMETNQCWRGQRWAAGDCLNTMCKSGRENVTQQDGLCKGPEARKGLICVSDGQKTN